MAAILAGIHHGITSAAIPAPMVSPGEVLEEEITLPPRWEAALDAFDDGKVLPQYLGKRYHKLFATCRREECDRFHAADHASATTSGICARSSGSLVYL